LSSFKLISSTFDNSLFVSIICCLFVLGIDVATDDDDDDDDDDGGGGGGGSNMSDDIDFIGDAC